MSRSQKRRKFKKLLFITGMTVITAVGLVILGFLLAIAGEGMNNHG